MEVRLEERALMGTRKRNVKTDFTFFRVFVLDWPRWETIMLQEQHKYIFYYFILLSIK